MLTKSLYDISSDSPRTQVGVLRIKQVAAKVGPEIKGLMVNILGGLATEAAKQQLGIK
ncbi:hypothetical protein JCM21738_5419 [Mesobacillus boroniphilus JCM 21738]|uniref:Uncharacterized protein n=2 Tax=Mesobacillus boroniphilus TaxID=308892 RepID=W4RVI3_9BACI|nr:hypothetical protein JCM21738_5419 [Mesobacillus boroniphilus JCM 21738]